MNLIEMDGFLRGKCIPGDMLVNESNAEYLVRKFQEMSAQRDALAAENAGLKNAFGPGDSVLNFLTIALRHTTYDQIDLDDVTLAFKMSLPETPATDDFLDEVRASAIPDGYKLVPEQMYLDAEDIQVICMQCGDGNKKGYGEFVDGIFWVGELSNDEGVIKYGLNVADANYPEEGSITVFEFDEPPFAAKLRQGAAL